MLKYYLDSNLYFLEIIELLLDFLKESNDKLDNEVFKIAKQKLMKQGGRYSLFLKNKQIKEYFSYNSNEKTACIIFLIWIGIPEKDLKELIICNNANVFELSINILKKWYKKKYNLFI